MEQAAVRDLEQIQEQDEGTQTPRALTLRARRDRRRVHRVRGPRDRGAEDRRRSRSVPIPSAELVAAHGKTAGGASTAAAATSWRRRT